MLHRFEDGDAVAHQREIVGACETGRTRADDRDLALRPAGDLVARRESRYDRELCCRRPTVPAIISRTPLERERFGAELIGEETLERADRDRRVDFAAAACVFAGRAAGATADRGDRIGRARDAIGFGEASFRDQLNVAARVGLDRARIETRHVLAKPPQVARRRVDRFVAIDLLPRRYFLQKVLM